jgi:predicted transposase/invertase (TIGR01784 family)
MKHLDPKNDIVFKKIFGKNKHLLMSLLNDLLMLNDNERIQSIEYLSPEQIPDVLDLKNSIVDVKCTDQNERIFIVEMQMLWTESFKQRVLFNASKAYVSQLGRGHKYTSLYPVYSLNILNENYHSDKDQYYHRYNIVENTNTHERIDGLEFVFIELPKFLKNPNSMSPSLRKLWLTLLTISETSEIPEELKKDPLTNEALKLTEESYYKPGEKAAYERYWDAVSSARTLIDESKMNAMAKGKAEGLAEGKAEGTAEGLAKGKEEVARNLLVLGIDIEAISKATGLSIEEIKKLASV